MSVKKRVTTPRAHNAPFSVRLSKYDLSLLRKICTKERRTAADEIRYLIDKELAHLGIVEKTCEPGMTYEAAVKS